MMRSSAALLAVAAAIGCSKGSGEPTVPATTCAGAVDTLQPLGVATVSASNAGCIAMPADGSTYIVVPQFAAGGPNPTNINYEIGSGAPAMMDRLPMVASARGTAIASIFGTPQGVRARFERALRERERRLAAARAGRPRAQAAIVAAAAVPVVGDSEVFNVCTDLNCSVFKKDTAYAQFVGTRIAIFVSKDAPAGGLTQNGIDSLGTTFDTDLYPIDTVVFGAPSDVDGNQRVIVLMSPKVNSITPANICATQGYIAGFFDGLDLEVGQPNSNNGEVFYSIVADPTGQFSCTHTAAAVEFSILPTFIHEFQHMISFNQHVLIRGGFVEDTWLNEGLSHIAEELGSRYYEAKYPISCVCQRSNPGQLFPDSSQGFIGPDLINSYTYLFGPDTVSTTIFRTSGSLTERGAAWLFLRWLGDQYDSTIYGKLDQTILTGTDNVAAQAGQPFAQLFGDYAMADYSDSLPGLPRASAPARNRFVSRNLRQIYNRIYTTSQGGLPLAFPIVTSNVPVSGRTSGQLLLGSMSFWKVTMPTVGSAVRLYFAGPSGASFPAAYDAQVTVLRCPSAGVCP